jgi:hypothetical protein
VPRAERNAKEADVRRRGIVVVLAGLAFGGAAVAADARPGGWSPAGGVREQVVSSPVLAGGYPGAAPAPGGCVAGPYDANQSESALALRPGTEQLVGGAKAYFERWSTFKAQHTVSFAFGTGSRPSTHIVNGFDCVTTGTQAMPPSWTNVTDPNLAWDLEGRVHQIALPFNAYWGSVEQPNGDVVGIYSDDGGRTWRRGNGGAPIQPGPNPSTQSANFLDKPWVAVNQVPGHPWANHVYAVWVEFLEDGGSRIWSAVSRDRGSTWSTPAVVPTGLALDEANPWPFIAVGADGVVHLTFVDYDGEAATIWTMRSSDDGRSWQPRVKVADTRVIRSCCLPGTHVHDGVVEFAAASPERPGHLFVTWERFDGRQLDVQLARSTDGGRTWSAPVTVNDDGGSTDQFQPEVAAGPDGAVAVAFYDKRGRCPVAESVRAEVRGAANTCIGVSLQAFRDAGARLARVGGNARLSRGLWDPEMPRQFRGGYLQVACEDSSADCDDIFIGDYFQLAISRRNVYVLSTSTHYPSGVRADDGRPIYYQQQILHTANRAALGLLPSG